MRPAAWLAYRGIVSGPPAPLTGRASILLGWTPSGPARWNLLHAPHLLIAGRTGSGKSSAMNAAVAGLPDLGVRWQVMVFDPKGLDFAALAGPATVLNTVDEMRAGARWLADELVRRAHTLEHRGCRSWVEYQGECGPASIPLFPLLVLVDEAVDVMNGGGGGKAAAADIAGPLGQVIRRGRALGMHVAFSMLRPDAEALGPGGGLLREQLTARLALGATSSEALRMMRVEDLDVPAHRGYGVGIGMTRATEDRPALVRIPWVPSTAARARLDQVGGFAPHLVE